MPAGTINPDKQDLVVSVRVSPRLYAMMVRLMEKNNRPLRSKSDPLKFAFKDYAELVKEHELVEEVSSDEEVVDILERARLMWDKGTRNHERLMKNLSREEADIMGMDMKQRTKEDAQTHAHAEKLLNQMSTEEKQEKLAGGHAQGGNDVPSPDLVEEEDAENG